jgi:hypothetical protein
MFHRCSWIHTRLQLDRRDSHQFNINQIASTLRQQYAKSLVHPLISSGIDNEKSGEEKEANGKYLRSLDKVKYFPN